jgi:hypothetical protein
MPNIRVFNDAGMREFAYYLERLRNDARIEPPSDLLTDPKYTQLAPGAACVSVREFSSKLEFGRYIAQMISGKIPDSFARTSAELWAWLVLFFLDQVCPKNENGHRKVLKSAEKYISRPGHISKGLEKHLLYLPWKMCAFAR